MPTISETGGPEIEAALAILTAVSALHETLPAPYRRRLERLAAWSERDQRDLAYRRVKWAKHQRDRLPSVREHRSCARTSREADAAKKHANELFLRRDQLYAVRFQAIAARVQAELRIKPAGQSRKSFWRWKNQMEEALGWDAPYHALQQRQKRYLDRHWARQSRCHSEQIAAGVLAVDDRVARRAKVRAWRERSGIACA